MARKLQKVKKSFSGLRTVESCDNNSNFTIPRIRKDYGIKKKTKILEKKQDMSQRSFSNITKKVLQGMKNHPETEKHLVEYFKMTKLACIF